MPAIIRRRARSLANDDMGLKPALTSRTRLPPTARFVKPTGVDTLSASSVRKRNREQMCSSGHVREGAEGKLVKACHVQCTVDSPAMHIY